MQIRVGVKTVVLWFLWASSIILGFVWNVGVAPVIKQPGHPLLNLNDPDHSVIVPNLLASPDLASTLRWWMGSWAHAPDVLYFRPLTSLLWWFQLQAFGVDGLNGFTAVHWVAHIALCLLLIGFLRHLFGLHTAILISSLWAISAATLLTLPSCWWALAMWKDQPETWIGITAVCASWAWLSFLRTQRPRYFWLALLAYFVGILFKESGYVLLLLLALVSWHENKVRKLLALWPFAMLAVLCLMYRTWALQGPGYRLGPNKSWWVKLLIDGGGGRLVNPLLAGEFLPLGLALLFLGLALAFRFSSHRWLWSAAGVAAYIGCSLLTDWFSGSAWGESAIRPLFLFPLRAANVQRDGLIGLGLLAMWVNIARHLGPDRRFGYGWFFIVYFPALISPIGQHVHYVPSIGWAILLGLWMRDYWRWTSHPRMTRLKTLLNGP